VKRYTIAILIGFTAIATGALADDTAVELESTFVHVAEDVSEAVVLLEVKSTWAGGMDDGKHSDPFLEYAPEGFDPLVEGSGSGIIIDEAGHIVTNYHVVRGAIEIVAVLNDGRRREATLVGEDPDTDLAIVRIEDPDLAVGELGEMADVHVGQWAIAIGAPYGLSCSMTVGHVSATGRRDIGPLPIQDFIQTDASINPGNSGGPLVDIQGKVIGINTMIIGHGTGIGLAIPVSLVREVSTELIREGTMHRGQIGVVLQDGDADLLAELGAGGSEGVVISRIEAGGGAHPAGMERGDVVTTFAGQSVADRDSLQRLIYAAGPGEVVKIKWLRDGKPGSGEVTIGTHEARQAGSREGTEHTGDDLGFNVETLPPDLRSHLGWGEDAAGLMVTTVRAGSPAQRAGIEFSDIILEAGGNEVHYPIDVARATIKSKSDKVLLYVYNWGMESYRYVSVDKP